MNEKSLFEFVSRLSRCGVVYVIQLVSSVRRQMRKEERGNSEDDAFLCAHIFVIFFGPLFLSLSKYIIYFPPFVFYFCCWFFLPHFFVTLLHTKSAALEETTTRLFRPHVVLNGQPTLDERAESAGARPPPPPSPCFFFVRERARALLFFVNATTRCPPLSQREVVILRFAKDSHKEIFVSSFEIARCN